MTTLLKSIWSQFGRCPRCIRPSFVAAALACALASLTAPSVSVAQNAPSGTFIPGSQFCANSWGGTVVACPTGGGGTAGYNQAGAAIGNAIGNAIGRAIFAPGGLLGGPNPAEIAAQQQQYHNETLRLNDLGIDAYHKGDWSTAVSYFQQALSREPNDATLKANLAHAQGQVDALAAATLREKQRETAEAQADNKAAGAIHNALARSADSALAPTAPEATQLSFMAAAPAAGSTPAFGATSTPAAPNLDATALPGQPVSTASAQAVGAAETGRLAAAASSDPAKGEAAKALSNCQWDSVGCTASPPAPLTFSTADRDPPKISPDVAAALAKDQDYQRLAADRAKAQSDAAAAQRQLDKLTAQQQAEPDKKAEIQIEISDVTQRLNADKSTVETDNIGQEKITKRYQDTYTVLPASPKPAALGQTVPGTRSAFSGRELAPPPSPSQGNN
jgi:hypothetical protein